MLRYVSAAAVAASMACVGSVILFQFNPVFQLIFKVGLVLIYPSGFYQLQNTSVVVFITSKLYYCVNAVDLERMRKTSVVGLRHTCTPVYLARSIHNTYTSLVRGTAAQATALAIGVA